MKHAWVLSNVRPALDLGADLSAFQVAQFLVGTASGGGSLSKMQWCSCAVQPQTMETLTTNDLMVGKA